MSQGVRWWGAALLVAVLLGLGVHWVLRPMPERSHLGLVQTDPPADWMSLPLAARAITAKVNERQDAIDHVEQLGPFEVRWSYVRYQDRAQFIGPFGWKVIHPDLPGPFESSHSRCLSPPDTLHHGADEASWVLTTGGVGEPCVAFRRARIVDAAAEDASSGQQLGVAVLVALLALAASLVLRRAWRLASPG